MVTLTRAAIAAPRVSGRRRRWVAPAAVGLFAALVSMTGSWIPSQWGDEAASVLSAQRSLPSLFRMLGNIDAVHGAYYFGLHGWIDVFGASAFSVRLPSALAVGGTTALLVVLCRRLGRPRLGVLAGIVAALIPRLTYVGVDARSYAFSALIATAITLVFVELLRRRPRPLWLWIAYGALTALGTSVFLYAALLVLAQAVVLLVLRSPRRFAWSWIAATAAAALAASPVIVFALRQRQQVEALSDRKEVSPKGILVEIWFDSPWVAAIAWALVVVAVGGTVLLWVRRSRAAVRGAVQGGAVQRGAVQGSDGQRIPVPRIRAPRRPTVVLVALTWLVVPTVALLAASPFMPLFSPRYLAFCAPAVAILMSEGLIVLARPAARPGWVVGLGLAVIAATVAPVYVAQRTPYAMDDSDWKEIADTVRAHAKPDDTIAFDDATRPSRRPRLAMRMYPDAFAGLRDVTLGVPYDQTTSWHDSALPFGVAVDSGRFTGVDRVWMVEFAPDASSPGRYGLDDLKALGFTEVARYPGHRSVVVELER